MLSIHGTAALALLCATSVLAPSGAVGAPDPIELELEYLRFTGDEDPDGHFPYQGELDLVCQATPPAGEWKLPELVSEEPLYALATLGESEHLFVLDKTEADDLSYSRVFCDANANRDLTDDAVIGEGEGLATPGLFESAAIDLKLVVEGKKVPYSLSVVAFSEEMVDVLAGGDEWTEPLDLEEFTFTLLGNSCYIGSFDFGGKAWQVMLADDNVNGRFGDRIEYVDVVDPNPHRALEVTGDLLLLTDAQYLGELDGSILGTAISFGGQLFAIEVDAVGSALTFTPLEGELGTLELPLEPERLSLASEDGESFITLLRPGKRAQVPPGQYRVGGYHLYREDGQGDRWFLSATATPASPFAGVGAGKAATLPWGEPFKPTASIPQTAYDKFERGTPSSIQIEFSILGQGSEIVNDLRHVSGDSTELALDPSGDHPEEPAFKVMTGKGKVVAGGVFEYG